MCVCMHVFRHACVHVILCCYKIVLAIIVICLNIFFLLFVFLNSFVHLQVTLMVCFKANFLLRK